MHTTSFMVGGVSPFTTTDYPNHLAYSVFIAGCPWRCTYCHNNTLQARKSSTLDWGDILKQLSQRQHLIDAVIFSGGEPTIDSYLPTAMQQIKEMGFKVGLHTAGIYPKQLQRVLPLVDWVGLDIKTSWDQYDALTGCKGSAQRVQRSLLQVLEAKVDYECRTTIHPQLHNETTLISLITTLSELYQIKNYALQHYKAPAHRSEPVPTITTHGYPSRQVLHYAKQCFSSFVFRSYD